METILSLPTCWAVFIIAALPLIELRGAIPLGLVLGLSPVHVFVLAVLGNILPVPLLLSTLGPLVSRLVNSSIGNSFVSLIKRHTHWKRQQVTRSGVIGLFILTVIPLPSTGAWTASIIAALLGLQKPLSMAVIAAGVIVSGIVVLFLSTLGMLSLHQWLTP